jgi:hypothetical protein
MPRYYNGGTGALVHEELLPVLNTTPTEEEKACGLKCGSKKENEETVYGHAYCSEMSERGKIIADMRRAHPLGAPNRSQIQYKENKAFIKRPDAFSERDQLGRLIESYEPWEPGSVCISIHEVGWFVVPPGGHVDIDRSVPVESIKSMAPHLLTEQEWQARKPVADTKTAPAKQPRL